MPTVPTAGFVLELNQLVHSEELLLQLWAQVNYEEFVLLALLLNSRAAIPSEGARSASCR